MNALVSNEFALVIDSFGADGTRPTATMGVNFTPGNNTYGTYVQIISGATLTDDAYGFLLNVNTIGANTFAYDSCVTVGLDPAGGTSYTDFITDLLVGPAATGSASGLAAGCAPGVEFYWPIFVKSGTSVGIKASTNNASPPATGRAFARFYCQPYRPDTLRVGSRVVTYGSTPASSSGTGITQGTTSDGTYVQLGTVAAGDCPWFWHLGVGSSNAAMVSCLGYTDLAIGSSTSVNRQVITNERVHVSTSEQLSAVYRGGLCQAVPGDLIYGRQQSPVAAQAGFSMAAYGVI